ncbi:MAG: DNA polymerase III subunit delta' [Thermomicrobium sp.]|nr:DNA polymerase III subunit delta' [Thermomicrobium sp.]MDW8058856.1 DNA polymerase III subunit delta' [Thermomicrobium sp.]
MSEFTHDIPTEPTPRWPVLGHEPIVAELARSLRTGHVHHAYLFAGPAGIGRTTLAYAFAAALLCEAPVEARPCGQCRACQRVARRVHPDVTRVSLEQEREDAKLVSIDRIRELRANLSLRPLEGAWRVAIVDDAERLSRDAADALLKTLEEPPPYAVLVLIAEDANAVPETIRSRCRTYQLRPLPPAVVEAALVARGASPDRAARLAKLARGRIAEALRLAEDADALDRYERQVAEVVAAMSEPLAAIGFARRATDRYRRGQRVAVQQLLRLAAELWRDAVWLAADPAASIVHEEARGALLELARRRGLAGTVAGLAATLQCLADLEANVQARLALDAVAVVWTETAG